VQRLHSQYPCLLQNRIVLCQSLAQSYFYTVLLSLLSIHLNCIFKVKSIEEKFDYKKGYEAQLLLCMTSFVLRQFMTNIGYDYRNYM